MLCLAVEATRRLNGLRAVGRMCWKAVCRLTIIISRGLKVIMKFGHLLVVRITDVDVDGL
jgi:hypothetical protein